MTRNQLVLCCWVTFAFISGMLELSRPPILSFTALWGMAECIRLAIQNEKKSQIPLDNQK